MAYATPAVLNKHVVDPAAFAIHANLDVGSFGHIGNVCTGELVSLIRVGDLRTAVGLDSVFQRLNKKVCVQGIRDTPRQDFS